MQTVPNMTKILNPQKTYIIGLGGSGVKTAALIKFYLSRLFDLETTNFFRFRFIDCQEPALEIGKIDPGINDINENLQIGVDITDGLVKNNYIEKRLEPYFNNYHATDNRVTGTKDGAGVTRPYSLISLFAHVDEVYDKLAEDFAALSTAGTLQLSDDAEKEGYEIQRHDNDVPNILLFSSLTGGTGAGATLDIAALARQAASKSGNNPKLFAFLFLPDVFTESVNDPDIQDITPENIKQIQANGYAALKELEYYVNGNRFYCQYNHNITVDISNDPGEKLCDKMVLINRYNTSGNTPVHNPREAFKATAEGALHFITSQIAGDLPNRIIDNRMDGQMFPAIGVHLPLRDNGRRKQLYASMGIYTIDIPANEIRDWFTLKVIDNFFKDMRKTPLSREQIQPVVRNNTLSERDDILGKLGILHFSGGQSRLVSQKPLINKMLFKKLKGFVQKKIQYPVEPDSQNNVYRSVKEISKLKDWDCNGKGTLYNDSQKKIKEVLEKFHSDYIHDFKNPKEKKLIDLYTDSNLSLDEMIIEIINGNEEIGISDIETMLTMIIEELDEFEKQLLAFRNNNKLRYFSISEDVQQLTKTIEAESNWIQGFDLKQVDDFKEEWDLKKVNIILKLIRLLETLKKIWMFWLLMNWLPCCRI
ncbi:MAG: tubulin-like doman-containing protein [candidate division KSB1 bacterium]|nr:tubulin-like doman-containing protein [candidate division KSB1 bacterium]